MKKAKIQEKEISRSLSFNDQESDQDILYEKIYREELLKRGMD